MDLSLDAYSFSFSAKSRYIKYHPDIIHTVLIQIRFMVAMLARRYMCNQQDYKDLIFNQCSLELKGDGLMKDMSREEIERLLSTEQFGMLALTDGVKPYCIPMAFAYANNCLYLVFYERGRKWHYVQTNSNVCFNVYNVLENERSWSSAMVEGKLTRVSDLKEIRLMLETAIKRSGGDPTYLENIRRIVESMAVKTYKIEIREMGGKKAGSQQKRSD